MARQRLDYTRWFQREIGKIDLKIGHSELTPEQNKKLWDQRDRLMNEPGYAEGLYLAWQRAKREEAFEDLDNLVTKIKASE